MLAVPWLLEREYRQHRLLDTELPETHVQWLATMDSLLQREAIKELGRISKVVIHPSEIETWARHQGRPVNEHARSDYADLLWRTMDSRFRAGAARRMAYQIIREQGGIDRAAPRFLDSQLLSDTAGSRK